MKKNKTIIASNKFIYLHVIVVVKFSRGTLNIIFVLRGLLTLKKCSYIRFFTKFPFIHFYLKGLSSKKVSRSVSLYKNRLVIS